MHAFFFAIFLTASTLAAETDAFTLRYRKMQDGLAAVQQEMQQRIRLGLTRVQAQGVSTGKCDWQNLDEELGKELRRPLVGMIEDFINNSGKVDRVNLNLSETVYGTLPLIDRFPLVLGGFFKIGLAGNFHHNGWVIGADKLGHFIDEGHTYYTIVHQAGRTLQDALEIGDFSEKSIFGIWTGGVLSYADLAANYDGYHFWKDLLGPVGTGPRASIYFTCNQGVWTEKIPLDLAKYVSGAWDEGMNCNEYRSAEMAQSIQKRISELEKSYGRRLSCPVYPDRIQAMVKRYGVDAARVINPRILKAAKESPSRKAGQGPVGSEHRREPRRQSVQKTDSAPRAN
ncbi:MAG: hypothetical protein JNL01_03245 [Bdellovibrionales bacterium]|nr:hypothetical protein [Bdellovibrionales bacterium]